MAKSGSHSEFVVCRDPLHSLFRQLRRDGEDVIELWATIHGELVILTRRVPLAPHDCLDEIQAKIQSHAKGK